MPLFRRSKKQPTAPPEHAVIMHLPLSDDDFGSEGDRAAVSALEDRIIEAVAPIAGTMMVTSLVAARRSPITYGPDANELFDAIKPCLEGLAVRPGAYAIKRFGPATDPSSAEERVSLA